MITKTLIWVLRYFILLAVSFIGLYLIALVFGASYNVNTWDTAGRFIHGFSSVLFAAGLLSFSIEQHYN